MALPMTTVCDCVFERDSSSAFTVAAVNAAISSCSAWTSLAAPCGGCWHATQAIISLNLTSVDSTACICGASLTRPAYGSHCSSAPASSATSTRPVVREILASVCTARMNLCDTAD